MGSIGGIEMTLKEVLEIKVIGLIPIGECDCSCGEEATIELLKQAKQTSLSEMFT